MERSYIGRLESGHAPFGSEMEERFAKFFRVDIVEFYKEGLLFDPVIEKVSIMMQEMVEDEKRDVLKYAEEKKLISGLRRKKAG